MRVVFVFRVACIVVMLFRILSARGQTGELVDVRDGRVYKTVQIGNQTWMAENLAFAKEIANTRDYQKRKNELWDKPKYPTGYTDAEWDDNVTKTNESLIYCYNDSLDNCQKYGCLYTWESALKSCPVGWHLPSTMEYDSLLLAVGNEGRAYDALISDRKSDFGVQLAGYLQTFDDVHHAKFVKLGRATRFWTSSDRRPRLRMHFIDYFEFSKSTRKVKIERTEYYEYKTALYVRCIKD